MSSIVTNNGMKWIINGTVDVLNDTLKYVLLSTAYVPDPDHDYISDVASYELSGPGYVAGFGNAGRHTLTTPALVVDDTNDAVKLTADDPSWTGLDAGTVGYIAVVKEVTSDADSNLVFVIDVQPDYTSDGSDWTFSWGSDGVMKWKMASA